MLTSDEIDFVAVDVVRHSQRRFGVTGISNDTEGTDLRTLVWFRVQDHSLTVADVHHVADIVHGQSVQGQDLASDLVKDVRSRA